MKITWAADDLKPGRQVQMSEFPGITGRWMVGYRLRDGHGQPAAVGRVGLRCVADRGEGDRNLRRFRWRHAGAPTRTRRPGRTRR